MAGRGRGGGRGRGRGMTFDVRDLGFGAGEQLPAPVLQPPPAFPTLENQPAPMITNAEMLYMVAVKKDLIIYLKDHLALSESGEVRKELSSQLDWALIPEELKPTKKRKGQEAKPRIAKKTFDLNALDALEKLEEVVDDPEEGKEERGEENEEEGNENNDEETEEDVDEEMDDGTDYVNNYFDNGEGLDDDDDMPNDGPIY